MNLLFLYGSPGVGKMTVSKYISNITGWTDFHLHHTIDYVRSIFPREIEGSEELVDDFSLKMINFASRNDIDLIYTYVYAREADDYFIRHLIKLSKKNNINIFFVNLVCDFDQNITRIKDKKRNNFKKIISVKKFKDLHKKYDLLSSISYVNNLVVETTNQTEKQTADFIVKKLSIKCQKQKNKKK